MFFKDGYYTSAAIQIDYKVTNGNNTNNVRMAGVEKTTGSSNWHDITRFHAVYLIKGVSTTIELKAGKRDGGIYSSFLIKQL